MIKNVWPRIQANSIYRITKPNVSEVQKVFVPKAILWTKREASFKSMDLQTQLNNAIIQFLNKKVG